MHALKRTMAAGLAAMLLAAGAARGDETAAPDSAATAQTTMDRLDGMNEQLQTLQTDMDRLKRFKFSGYIQARWETAENRSDTVKVSGNPPTITPANDQRFYIRRGRFKLTYDAAPLSQGAIQFDGASSGASINVRLLEAYVTLLDPWTPLHQHAFTIGQILIPFGYEIERSSAVRELPEFSRAENVLFNAEYDRGIKLVSQWTPRLETVVAVLNGGGISDATTRRSIRPSSRTCWRGCAMRRAPWTGRLDLRWRGRDPAHRARRRDGASRFGADIQTYYQMPGSAAARCAGSSTAGHDVNPDSVKALTTTPGSGSGTVIKPGAIASHFATDVLGWYVMAVQNLGERLQFAARYDFYDRKHRPSRTTSSLASSVGLNWFYDTYTRVSVSYDVPRTDRLVAGNYDDPKDNLWTVQFQHQILGGRHEAHRLHAVRGPGLGLASTAWSAGRGLTIKGSDTMVVLGQRWAEEYMKKHPGTISGHGRRLGHRHRALINGTTDVCEASRPMKDDEKRKLRDRYSAGRRDHGRQGRPVVYVNDQNPLKELTIEQLATSTPARVTNWKEVGGADARDHRSTRARTARARTCSSRSTCCSARDYAPRAQTMPGTAAVVNAVAKDERHRLRRRRLRRRA